MFIGVYNRGKSERWITIFFPIFRENVDERGRERERGGKNRIVVRVSERVCERVRERVREIVKWSGRMS